MPETEIPQPEEATVASARPDVLGIGRQASPRRDAVEVLPVAGPRASGDAPGVPSLPDRPLRLFVSFAPADRDLKDALLKHLSVLQRFGGMEVWSADRVRPGDDWRREVEDALASTDLALLLLSSDFLASDFLQDQEVPKLFERREKQGLLVVPIILRSCLWEMHPWLSRLSPLPADRRALASHDGDERDRAMTDVAGALVTQAAVAKRRTNLWSRGEVRDLLRSSLLRDADLDAFCIDYFPQVFQRFAPGFDRLAKENLLLGEVAPDDVVSAIERLLPGGSVEAAAASLPEASGLRPGEEDAAAASPSSRPGPGTPIADIFRTSGLPAHTFVEPSQAAELKVRLRTPAEGLLVEGPSGVGKTTAVVRALRELGLESRKVWISALSEKDRDALDALIETDFQQGGYLVVDDFHRLDTARQAKLTSLIKILSDRNRRDAKVTLIGVNPIGDSLLALNPDVFNRFAVVTMGRQPDGKVDQLVRLGERAANVSFSQRPEIVRCAAGSFVIAQRLCLEAAFQSQVFESGATHVEIDHGPDAVIRKVHQDLAGRFRARLAAFASFDERPPPRGACLSLLWHLARSETASVRLDEVRYRQPGLVPVFSWLMASNLARCFVENTGLSLLLHYDRQATVLSADDPQLAFYLHHLDWPDFAQMTGHQVERWDAQDGPVFAARAANEEAGTLAGRADARSGAYATLTGAAAFAAAPARQSGAILHLSDLHFGTSADATRWLGQLAADLQHELSITQLDAVLVSGDIANRAERDEYAAALRFFQELQSEFGLSPQKILLVPGNHDVSWPLSEQAYTPVRRRSYKGPLTPGMYIDGGEYVELRADAEYRERMRPFADFYQALRLEPYPLDPSEQATVHHLPELSIVAVGLNSCWEIDHHYTARASVHTEALSRALQQIRNTPAYAACLKLAVWHHALSGEGEDRIKDAGFLEQLAQAGFRVGLHGHVHKADSSLYRYHRQAGGLEILGAGTFGAPASQWVPGYPLQYQLLQLTEGRFVVHTRRREELNGAWKPDARWLQAPGKDPVPRYDISL
jgi:hypothetical protein